MIELAHFEYSLNGIFHQEADEKYTLATKTTPDDQLQLLPVFQLFEFQFPIRWYYTEFANKKVPELPRPYRSYCVVLRHNYRLALFDLRQEQFYFLHYLKAGNSIETTKQLFVERHSVETTQLDQIWLNWKECWTAAGFFCAKL